MTHLRITGSCFGFGRSFDEHQVLEIADDGGAECVSSQQARELFFAGRAVYVTQTPLSARPLSVESAEAVPAAETASAKPARSRRTKV